MVVAQPHAGLKTTKSLSNLYIADVLNYVTFLWYYIGVPCCVRSCGLYGDDHRCAMVAMTHLVRGCAINKLSWGV